MKSKMSMPWLRFIEGADEGPAAKAPEGESPEKETDWESEAEKWKHHARTWEERAKSNAEAQKRLDEIEEQVKSEAEKLAERIRETEARDAALAERERQLDVRELVTNIASEFHISKEDRDLYLTATDEETLRKQAEGLAARRGAENPHQGRGTGGPNKQSVEDWATSLLGK